MNFKNFGVKSGAVMLMLGTLVALTCLSSCQRMQDMLTPATDTPPSMEGAIKIGLIQPADYYVTFGRGAVLAQAIRNEQGGVLGRRLEFIHRDNQTAPNTFPDVDKTIALATALVEDEEIVALLGPIFSSIAVQVGPTIQALQRPTILGSAGTLSERSGRLHISLCDYKRFSRESDS